MAKGLVLSAPNLTLQPTANADLPLMLVLLSLPAQSAP